MVGIVLTTSKSSPSIKGSKKRQRSSSLSFSLRTTICGCCSYQKVLLLTLGFILIGVYNLKTIYHTTNNTSNNNNKLTVIKGDRTKAFGGTKTSIADNEYDNPDLPYRGKHPPKPTHTACNNQTIRGIYHIGIGDRGGGVGTAFFQLMIDQILYAESQSLLPYIHLLPNISYVIDDPTIHHQSHSKSPITTTIRTFTGSNLIPYIPGKHRRDITPGDLNETAIAATTIQDISLYGTGIWGHYFEPISEYVPGDESCEHHQQADKHDGRQNKKIYVTIGEEDMYLVIPGLHGYHPLYSIKCWRYDFLPDYIAQHHLSYYEWITPQRQKASRVIQQYYQLRPYIVKRAKEVNPNCSNDHLCLGLHIRHSDKSAGRRVLAVSDFLPYCEQFILYGGKQIYLATDSTLVIQEIYKTWPDTITSKIVSTTNIIRSTNKTAVFDIANHHRTNQEVLVEIVALSYCQFMIHGHSAVSEAAIWMNYDTLHSTSVNIEDEDHLNVTQFSALLQMASSKDEIPKEQWPKPQRKEDLWPPIPPPQQVEHLEQSSSVTIKPTNTACNGYDGILLISSIGSRHTLIGPAIFTSIMNQLLYAEKYNLKPYIHLRTDSCINIYDERIHSVNSTFNTFTMMNGMDVGVVAVNGDKNNLVVGKPATRNRLASKEYHVPSGNGIWETYFKSVSDFVPGDESCRSKPLIEMNELVVSKLKLHTPWSIKAWRYDSVPLSIFQKLKGSGSTMKDWLLPMRTKASKLVEKYFHFQTYLTDRANEVNPNIDENNPCLAIHIRLNNKKGKYRRIIKAGEYLPYMEAFVKGGGRTIYVATDTQRPLQFMYKTFPKHITDMICTQGHHIVRSTMGDWPNYLLDHHHRVNSETLVDILALSKCSLFVHGYSTVSEAAIYLNPALHNNSINLEDPHHAKPIEFERLTRQVLGMGKSLKGSLLDDTSNTALSKQVEITQPPLHDPVIIRRREVRDDNKNHQPFCRKNAIVYLAQKVHSTYSGRDSYSKLLRSLDLLNKNYLSFGNHKENLDVFIFHTGEYNKSDLRTIEEHLNIPKQDTYGLIHLVDISDTKYWTRPKSNLFDNPSTDWYAYPLFSEGYRRMMHFFAIDIWDFFTDYNVQYNCQYRYIFRLDEDSYIHSAITYDVFDHMLSNQYVYGYRLCAYEMKVTQRMTTMFMKRYPKFVPKRQIDLNMCGFYNNFFVADLQFFRSPLVQQFIHFIDKQGHIYRRRLGDLMIHSMIVYWFAPSTNSIYRFLDFTYEHGTYNETNHCLVWGGIQAGYNDKNAYATISQYNDTMKCPVNTSILTEMDLSPSYSHLPTNQKGNVNLLTITAGNVELPAGKGILSG